MPPARTIRHALAAALTLGIAAGCDVIPALDVQVVVQGLDHPWDAGFTPDGTMLFTERPGRINALLDGSVVVLAAPSDVLAVGEGGMLGLAVDPGFASNRWIYTCFDSTAPPGAANDVRVVRWRVDESYGGLAERVDLVTGMPVNDAGQTGRHSGCRPRFGPGGYLWIATGDAATGTNPQDLTSLGGKVLRVDAATGEGAPDNPFSASANANTRRLLSYGHRNVQGLAFHPLTGDPYGVEHGSTRDDEVNRLLPGGNYGWDPVPGYNESVPMTDLVKFPNAIAAVWSSGSPTIAPSGATFLSGAQWQSWNGALAVAVLKAAQLRVFRFDGNGAVVATNVAITDRGRLRSAVQGPDGNLYVTTDNGAPNDVILRVVPLPPA